MNCANCFLPIKDGRKAAHCDVCEKPLHKECAISDGGTFCDVCYTVKEEQQVKPSFEIPSVIRRTHIELYKTCPYAFYMEVIKGMESPPTIYTQLGSDLHELFDQASQGQLEKKDMILTFNRLINEYQTQFQLSDAEYQQFYERGIDSIDTFYTIHKEMAPAIMTETNIQFEVGKDLPKVSITMDRINRVDGELEMVDWKTGNVMVGQKLSTDLQAPLYIYAVKEHLGEPVRQFTFYYLHENKERVFVRDPFNGDRYTCIVGKRQYEIHLTEAIKEVQRIFSRIIKGDFNIPKDTKKMYFPCKMCHLREKGACQGADVESWHQINERREVS